MSYFPLSLTNTKLLQNNLTENKKNAIDFFSIIHYNIVISGFTEGLCQASQEAQE